MEIDKEDNRYLRAKKRVERIKGFYTNLMMYIIFIAALAGLNYYTNQFRNPWFLWAAFGWGIGLLFQAMNVFNWSFFVGKDWEERKIKEFMDDDDDRENNNHF
ncbi:2TM domain-containing protein [Aequorivita marina]|uniref:2TM domain-containing protein n=1 Tax=Aequorivita marina TaxID=3073654 RepID=UPI002874F30A|nr:2TM domain-containing protein [Aequorivita sp. S2608]MDS1299642.1 2TM domain-containing protein [Aequorivita sp. S2608]